MHHSPLGLSTFQGAGAPAAIRGLTFELSCSRTRRPRRHTENQKKTIIEKSWQAFIAGEYPRIFMLFGSICDPQNATTQGQRIHEKVMHCGDRSFSLTSSQRLVIGLSEDWL